MSRGFTPRHAQSAGDLGFAMEFNAETFRTAPLSSARIVPRVTMDDCCRLVLLYHAVQHATDRTIPNDPPRMGAKSTTTSNHPIGLPQ